jgi:hypothetical protein
MVRPLRLHLRHPARAVKELPRPCRQGRGQAHQVVEPLDPYLFLARGRSVTVVLPFQVFGRLWVSRVILFHQRVGPGCWSV